MYVGEIVICNSTANPIALKFYSQKLISSHNFVSYSSGISDHVHHTPVFPKAGVLFSWTAVRWHDSTAASLRRSRQLCPHRPKMKMNEARYFAMQDAVASSHSVELNCGDCVEKGLVSFVVVNELYEDKGVPFHPKHEDKATDVNSLVIAQVPFEILEMMDCSFVQGSDLVNLLSGSREESEVILPELSHGFFNCVGVDGEAHNSSHHLLKPLRLIAFRLPDFNSVAMRFDDSTISFARDSLTSLVSSSAISDISRTFFINCSFLTSFNVSANACLATEDQLTQSVLDMSSFNSSGTDNVIVPIFSPQSNYLCYVYTKYIFKPFVMGDEKLN